MAALVKAENVTVQIKGKDILKDVSLTVGERDFITIIGPNGAGKSMLLKCLMGFSPIDEGVIRRAKNMTIGYVPQHFVPDHVMPMTARRFLQLRKKIDARNLEKLSEEVVIGHLLDRPLFVLSKGELQRILLARSLLDNPTLLVLDEPAQNLDVSGQLAFYKRLERMYEERNLTILMVSHDLHMVMASTKQVICLFHHICCSGEPHVVTQDPEFISLFGNDMAHMMAVYQHSHNHIHEG